MRMRTMLLIVLTVVATLVIGVGAADAKELLGCDGILQFPCPGPLP